MFENWGFLISEMVVLIVLAALVGLVVGWIIWGRRDTADAPVTGADLAEIERLKTELATCREAGADREEKIAGLQDALAQATGTEAASPDTSSATGPSEADPGTKPETLSKARGGQPDDLKQIRGVGPKLETLCHDLGFYHFDQIANWSADEVAWVDANLEGFKGRVSRDGWVEQARLLASGGTTDFSEKVKKGDVY